MGDEPHEYWQHLSPDEVEPGNWLVEIDGYRVRGGMMEVREVRNPRPETWEFMPTRKTRSSRFAYSGQAVKVSRTL
ncbi:hypothetical protein ACQP2U_43640 (plasmid) [Nocardia sp. CA-084685]|uniref:hypothetical protein n=1 Tax=Nocardia sp. CA-084685 TaxID=3239970 RepID=UPI003D98A684